MSKKLFLLLSLLLISLNGACSEEPQAVVQSKSEKDPLPVDESFEVVSLEYNGKVMLSKAGKLVPSNTDCQLFLGLMRGLDDHGQQDWYYLVRVTNQIHGADVSDMILLPHYLSLETGNYVEEKSDDTLASATLTGLILKDGSSKTDINEKETFQKNKTLKQSMEIAMGSESLIDFESAYEAQVNSNEKAISKDLKSLSPLEGSTILIDHGNHYDPLTCGVFKTSGQLVNLEYQIESHQDEDEEDHDHDNDHDHDHGHDHV